MRGAASQTADLQQWQDSTGTVLAYTRSDGLIYSAASTAFSASGVALLRSENSGGQLGLGKSTAQANSPGADNARIYLRTGTNAGTLKLVIRAGAAGAETTILDNIPQ